MGGGGAYGKMVVSSGLVQDTNARRDVFATNVSAWNRRGCMRCQPSIAKAMLLNGDGDDVEIFRQESGVLLLEIDKEA